MNAKQLWKEVGNFEKEPLPIWFCGECGIIHPGRCHGQKEEDWGKISKKKAEECCTPLICPECGDPVPVVSRGTYVERPSYHKDCRNKANAKREAKLMEDAEKLEEWDGWVYYDGPGASGDGEYTSDIGEIKDIIEGLIEDEQIGEEDKPEYLFVCKPITPFPLDLADYLERLDEHFQIEDSDCGNHLEGMEELQKALDIFNGLNKNTIIGYEPDYKRAVRIKW